MKKLRAVLEVDLEVVDPIGLRRAIDDELARMRSELLREAEKHFPYRYLQ